MERNFLNQHLGKLAAIGVFLAIVATLVGDEDDPGVLAQFDGADFVSDQSASQSDKPKASAPSVFGEYSGVVDEPNTASASPANSAGPDWRPPTDSDGAESYEQPDASFDATDRTAEATKSTTGKRVTTIR